MRRLQARSDPHPWAIPKGRGTRVRGSRQHLPDTQPHGDADQQQRENAAHQPFDGRLPCAGLGIAPGRQKLAQFVQIVLRRRIGEAEPAQYAVRAQLTSYLLTHLLMHAAGARRRGT